MLVLRRRFLRWKSRGSKPQARRTRCPVFESGPSRATASRSRWGLASVLPSSIAGRSVDILLLATGSPCCLVKFEMDSSWSGLRTSCTQSPTTGLLFLFAHSLAPLAKSTATLREWISWVALPCARTCLLTQLFWRRSLNSPQGLTLGRSSKWEAVSREHPAMLLKQLQM